MLESIPQAASCLSVFLAPHKVSVQTVTWHHRLTRQQDSRRRAGVLGTQMPTPWPHHNPSVFYGKVRGVADGSMAQWLSA